MDDASQKGLTQNMATTTFRIFLNKGIDINF